VTGERTTTLIVGAGLMGQWHAHAARRAGGLIAGVVDSDSAKAAALAARHRGSRAFTHTEAALGALSPNVVHVCTPLETHMGLIRAALAQRCHVIAEKPLAPTAAETDELLALAAATSRILVPVHQFAFQRGALQLGARLPSLGRIVHVEAGTATAGASRPGGPEPDAVVAEILPHFLSLTRRLLSANVAALPWSLTAPSAGDWRVSTVCGPSTVSIFVSTSARPTFAELRVLGARGSARLDLFHGFAVFEPGDVSREAKISRPFAVAARTLVTATANLARRSLSAEPAYPGLNELVARAYAAIAGAGDVPITPAETLDVALARDRITALTRA